MKSFTEEIMKNKDDIRLILHFIVSDLTFEVLFQKGESLMMNLIHLKDYLSAEMRGVYRLSTDIMCYENITGSFCDSTVSISALRLRDGMTLDVF